jgi:sugar (pentulose or hexulose) kinase
VLERLEHPREMLVELQLPGDVAGYVTAEAAAATGIPAGLPVVHTANDKAVEALGSGTLDEPPRSSRSAPTSPRWCTAATTSDAGDFWTNFACVPHRYLYESHGIRRGMWTLTWFLDLLGPSSRRRPRRRASRGSVPRARGGVAVPAGSDGLMTVLDWLAPDDKPFRKGVMLGFDARHTRAHVYRSILEAIALTMKLPRRRDVRELGIDLDRSSSRAAARRSPCSCRSSPTCSASRRRAA